MDLTGGLGWRAASGDFDAYPKSLICTVIVRFSWNIAL